MTPPIRRHVDGIREYLDPQTHDWVAGITSIVNKMVPKSGGVAGWQRKNANHEQLLARSAVKGTLMHHRLQSKLSEEDLDLPEIDFALVDEAMLSELELAEIMFESLKFDWSYPRWIEHPVYRREWPPFAGTPDTLSMMGCEGITPPGLLLVDYKSSSEIYESQRYQCGGYYVALPESRKPENCWIVGLNTDPKKNPFCKPVIAKLPRTVLDKYGEKFIDMAIEFYEERNDNASKTT